MRLMIHALFLAVGAGILALACDSKPMKVPTQTATEAVTPGSAESIQPPATGTPSASATPGAPALYPHPRLDELFVYTASTGEDHSGSRAYPRRSVVIQDLRSGTIVSTIPYSGRDGSRERYPVGAALAGRQIVTADESEVIRHELNGARPTTIFTPPSPQAVADIAVSDDGRFVAISSNCQVSCTPDNLLTFIEVATGTVVHQVRQGDGQFEGFRGSVWQLEWRDDGRGVFVAGATYSEQPGGRATVFLDGAVSVHPPVVGFATIAPNGRLLADAPEQLPCERVGGRWFAVTELDTGNPVAIAEGERGAYAAWEWSPDSSQVVYQFLPGDTATCEWAGSQAVELRLFDIPSARTRNVPTLGDVHAEWYGERFVEVLCEEPRPEEPVRNRWGDVAAICKSAQPGGRTGDLFLGGARIANWPTLGSQYSNRGIEPVGFLARDP